LAQAAPPARSARSAIRRLRFGNHSRSVPRLGLRIGPAFYRSAHRKDHHTSRVRSPYDLGCGYFGTTANHVLEKFLEAAYVFHAEGSLEAELWVLDRTLRILFGEVGQVVKGIRQSGLFGAKRKTLCDVADYLTPQSRSHAL
jgi:hypothetical protein